jgi:hypothetical protein
MGAGFGVGLSADCILNKVGKWKQQREFATAKAIFASELKNIHIWKS